MSNYLPADEEEKRLNLYRRGLTDKEIAEKLFLGLTTIQNWRRFRGLPPHGGAGRGGLRVNNCRHEAAMKRQALSYEIS